MPKQKLTKPVASSATSQPLWTRPELWLGLSTLIVIGIVAARSNFWKPTNQAVTTTSQTEQAKMEQNTQDSGATDNTAAAGDMEIKRLADTSGTINYVVAQKDTFWKIAKLVCDDESFAEAISTENGYGQYRALQTGDVLKISCK